MPQIILKDAGKYYFNLEKDEAYSRFTKTSEFKERFPPNFEISKNSKEDIIAFLLKFIHEQILKEEKNTVFNIVRLMTIVDVIKTEYLEYDIDLQKIFTTEATRLLLYDFDNLNLGREIGQRNRLTAYQCLNKQEYSASSYSGTKRQISRIEISTAAFEIWQVDFDSSFPVKEQFGRCDDSSPFNYEELKRLRKGNLKAPTVNKTAESLEDNMIVKVEKFSKDNSTPDKLAEALNQLKTHFSDAAHIEKIDELIKTYTQAYNSRSNEFKIANIINIAERILTALPTAKKFPSADINEGINEINSQICIDKLNQLSRLTNRVNRKSITSLASDQEKELSKQIKQIVTLGTQIHQTASPEKMAYLAEFLIKFVTVMEDPTEVNIRSCIQLEKRALDSYKGFKILWGAALIVLGALLITAAVVTSVAASAVTLGLAAPVTLPAGIGIGLIGVSMIVSGNTFLFFNPLKKTISENIVEKCPTNFKIDG